MRALVLMGFLAWGLANAAMAQSGPVPEVSGANPLYLYAHFADDDVTHLRIAHSRDARSYSEIDELGVYAARSFRDPSIMLDPGANSSLPGTYYVLATPSTACRVQFVSSDDLIAFKTGPVIDMSIYVPGCRTAWAPEWWQDPNGNTYFWISVGTAPYSYNTRKTPYLVRFDPLAGSVIGTPAAVELNGTTQANTFDYFPYYVAGAAEPYVLVYVDQQNSAAVAQPVAYATSATLTGPYTQRTPAWADYFEFGTLRSEAPAVVALGNTGCVRLMVDVWTYPQSSGARDTQRRYSQLYRDSCGNSGNLFSVKSLINGPAAIEIGKSEHGTVILVANPVDAGMVNKAIRAAQESRNSDTGSCEKRSCLQ